MQQCNTNATTEASAIQLAMLCICCAPSWLEDPRHHETPRFHVKRQTLQGLVSDPARSLGQDSCTAPFLLEESWTLVSSPNWFSGNDMRFLSSESLYLHVECSSSFFQPGSHLNPYPKQAMLCDTLDPLKCFYVLALLRRWLETSVTSVGLGVVNLDRSHEAPSPEWLISLVVLSITRGLRREPLR